MKENFLFVLFIIFLLLIIAITIFMFISLAKQGDERRDMIVGKTSTKTFAIAVLYMASYVVRNIYLIISGTNLSPDGMDPFVTLTTISLIYLIALVYHKKKYGD